MADKKQRLRDIIAAKSLLSGSFTLASGKASGYFFDMKKTMFDPEGASLVGELLCELACRRQPRSRPSAGWRWARCRSRSRSR